MPTPDRLLLAVLCLAYAVHAAIGWRATLAAALDDGPATLAVRAPHAEAVVWAAAAALGLGAAAVVLLG